MSRLDTVSKDTVLQNDYEYDLNSNRTSIDGGTTINATYDAQDRLETFTDASSTNWTFKYTDNGELERKYETGNQAATEVIYNYDVLGNLRGVDFQGTANDIEYIIDGRNRRVGKKVGGALVQQWLYKDQLNPIAELDGNGNITKRFIYASRANIPDIVVDVSGTSPVVYRIVSDHLGSPRFIINTADGTKALKFEYDEWGNETYQVFVPGIDRNLIPFGFAGGLYDEDTGLVRFGARDYDPEIGRWTSKDPLRFFGDGLNLYGYVLNSPINFADYFGLRITIIGDPSFKITIRKIIERIRSTKVGKDLVECLEASSINFKIKDVSGSGLGNEFDFPSNTIRIDPRLRPFYRTKDGGIARMSLERIVAHEMGHASGYGSRLEEEERIVRDIENPITKEFGERERGGYELVPKF